MENIDDVMAVLYAEPNESFVERRNELVKEIRSAGNRELAAEVKALRKPSAAARELNRIARTDPSGVTALLESVEALREGQAALVTGQPVDFPSLQATYRALVDALSSTAAEPYRFEVKSAIEAAALDTDGQHRLRKGTFVTAPASTGAFGFPTDFVIPAPGPELSPSKTKMRKTPEATATPTIDAAVERERAIRQEIVEAENHVTATEEAVSQANVEVNNLEAAIVDLETKLSALRAEQRAARRRLGDAVKSASRAESGLVRLRRAQNTS
ncbi:MAG: hypothetical protein HKN03_18040 [Acidimicrobiales bacterium]|nr:hypothetical protein [Acidimicrobiales bacterium]